MHEETARASRSAWPRRRRAMAWSMALILIGAMVLPLTGYVYVAISDAYAQQATSGGDGAAAGPQTNPRANYWRAVRQGYEGYTAASGPYTTNVLIQNGGQNWRQLRNGPVAGFGTWLLAVVVGAIVLFAIVRGQIKLLHAPSGRTVERWNLGERVLHWYVAVLFIVLAITGLSMLFGRAVLIPLLGYEGFAAWASVAIALHNYLGPFFVVGVVLEIIVWFRDALPERTDWPWLRQAGGFFSKDVHPSAGRINAGEKYLTFWLGLVVLGALVSISGIVMDFPNLGATRETMQTANVIHGIAAMLWIAITLGHIYLGAWGVEGTLQGMTSGRVSVEWARQHHDLWYAQEGRRTEAAEPKAGKKAARHA
ncbi:MAG TPA: formate dehydrogenase subunit gamma [Burkholderiales bacterium]